MGTVTAQISATKLEERDRLVAEMEAELGLAADHPEDQEILNTT